VTFSNHYGILDRWLHRLSFSTVTAQAGAADLESRLFRRQLAKVDLDAPVLITALPRAGTTVLLQLLAGSPIFASQTYRHMPFVLCPLLWERISRPFRRADTPRERAHGDGLQISLDTPESFEEVVWMHFWPEHYRGPCIEPWEKCDRPDFVEFLSTHMRKVVASCARDKPSARRYVSKNNVHIARIPAIWDALPDAQVVVLFREPLQQSLSLLRQHRRFTALHEQDHFARRYMAAIGHHDFGHNLKPVDFDGWFSKRSDRDADGLDFWVDYWHSTYRHVLRHAESSRLHLVDFDRLCETGDVGPLAERLSMDDPELLDAGRRMLRAPKVHGLDGFDVPAQKLDEARGLHDRLREVSIG
jgi:hypothetical protein